MRRGLGFLLLALCPLAHAEQPGTTEIRGTLGLTLFVDDLHAHLQTGAAVRYYITRRFSIEPEFQYLTGSNHHDDLMAGSNFNWDFREGRIVPYVTGGVGLLRSRFDSPGPRSSDTRAFGQAGAGVKVYLTDRWYIAPEYRIGWEWHVRGNVAVGYTFGR